MKIGDAAGGPEKNEAALAAGPRAAKGWFRRNAFGASVVCHDPGWGLRFLGAVSNQRPLTNSSFAAVRRLPNEGPVSPRANTRPVR